MGGVLRRPPVCEFALRIELRAAVVKAMTDLVPDCRAGGAVIGRGICFRIEKRRVQDGGGKVEPLLEWQIKGVDRLGSHPPFAASDPATELCQLVLVFPLSRAPVVAQGMVAP